MSVASSNSPNITDGDITTCDKLLQAAPQATWRRILLYQLDQTVALRRMYYVVGTGFQCIDTRSHCSEGRVHVRSIDAKDEAINKDNWLLGLPKSMPCDPITSETRDGVVVCAFRCQATQQYVIMISGGDGDEGLE